MKADQALAVISRLRLFRLEPDDVLVVNLKRPVTREQAEAIRRQIAEELPGRSVLVLDPSLDIEVIRAPEESAAAGPEGGNPRSQAAASQQSSEEGGS